MERVDAQKAALPVVGMVGGGQLARMTAQAAVALGQTLRGVLGGVAVPLVLPPPPQNARAHRVVARLRDGIADHLQEMAEVLAEQWPPEREEWTRHRHHFEPLIDATREAVRSADAGRRANLRARAYRARGQQLYEAAQTIARLKKKIAHSSQLRGRSCGRPPPHSLPHNAALIPKPCA